MTTAAPPASHALAETVPTGESGSGRTHVRSPVDVLRLVVGAVLGIGGVGVANLLDSTLLGLSADSTAAIDGLPQWARDLPETALGVAVMTASAAALVWSLVALRFRRFVQLGLGFVAAAALSIVFGEVIYNAVDQAVQQAFVIDGSVFRFRIDERLHPGDPILAGAMAMLVIASSYLSRITVLRIGALLAGYATFSVLTSGLPAVGLVSDVGAGLFIGSAALLLFGRHDLAPDAEQISRSMESVGMKLSLIQPVARTGGSFGSWRATTTTGQHLRIKAVSRDDISSDLMIRAFRWLRFRKTGDHRPFVRLSRAVEHEALVSLQVAASGVRTPSVLALVDSGVDNKLLVFADTQEKATQSGHEMTDAELKSLWRVAAQLQASRIAHHDLRVSNFGWDQQTEPLLLNLGFAEVAASEQSLGTDVAGLLASTAAAVGPERAVAAAHQAGGLQMLGRAQPWLQPLALSAETRQAVGGEPGLDAIRKLLVDELAVPAEEPVRLERVSGKNLFILATIGLSAWFLIPQLADIDNIWKQARSASPPWVVAAVAFSGLTYVAATGSLLGAIPLRLRFGPALLAQIASSFANRITPAKLGGVATNVRYFQRHGVPTAVGVTAVGLNAIAGLIMHILLTLWFLLLASGSENTGSLAVPSTRVVVLVLAILLAVVGASVALPITRKQLVAHVVPQLRSGWHAIRVISHSPGRLALLFGGSAAISLAYLAAMTASLKAFDSTASLPLIGLLFLTGSAVANAAPTPGGLGAAEAALIAALSTIEEAAIVIPAVFLYRLVTFWLPILPGWAALTYLRQTDNI